MASIELDGHRKPDTRIAYLMDGFRLTAERMTRRRTGVVPSIPVSPGIKIYRDERFIFPATKVINMDTLKQLMHGVYRIHFPLGIQLWDNVKDGKFRLGTIDASQVKLMSMFLQEHPRAPLRIFQDIKDSWTDVVWINNENVVPSYTIPERGRLWGRGRLATMVRYKSKDMGEFFRAAPVHQNPQHVEDGSTRQPRP